MNTGSDGEYFTDVPQDPIPPADTWNDLTVPQLYAVKAQLQDKLWSLHNVPAYAQPLNAGIAKIDAIIASRAGA